MPAENERRPGSAPRLDRAAMPDGNAAGHLLIAGLALLLPLLLYQVRHLDDNSLTSWQWVFQLADPWRLFLGLALLAPLCWLLALLPEWLGRGGGVLGGVRPMLLLPGLAFLACLPFLDTPEVIVDAARYFLQAKAVSEYGPVWFFREWGREIFAWTDLPLIPLLYGLILNLFEQSRLAVQLFNALLFSLTALLIVVLGRDLWDEETGVAGALLFLGFPYLYSQTPLLLVDIGTMFFLLLAMVALHRAMVRGGFCYPALCALAVAAVLLSKYSAWLLLSGLLPVVGCSLEAGRRPALRRAALALLPALLLVLPIFWYYREVMAGQIALLLEFQKPGLAGWSESLTSTLLFQTHPLLTAALFYSLYRAGRLRDLRYLILLWPVLLLLVLLEIRRIRYSIPVFPLLALLAAYGLRDLAVPALRRHLLLVVAGSSLLLAGAGFLPFLQTMSARNLQQAGRYLDTLAVEGVEVMVLPASRPVMDPRVSVPLLDLFTSRPLAYRQIHPPEIPPWVATSSLRFTWELPLAPFYATLSDSTWPRALVLIMPGDAAELPPEISEKIQGLELMGRFAAHSGIFQHRTLVEVYGSPPGHYPWLNP
ncbi:MAG: ArnT family glycosyltransferase [Desulfurivibrio sp.]